MPERGLGNGTLQIRYLSHDVIKESENATKYARKSWHCEKENIFF